MRLSPHSLISTIISFFRNPNYRTYINPFYVANLCTKFHIMLKNYRLCTKFCAKTQYKLCLFYYRQLSPSTLLSHPPPNTTSCSYWLILKVKLFIDMPCKNKNCKNCNKHCEPGMYWLKLRAKGVTQADPPKSGPDPTHQISNVSPTRSRPDPAGRPDSRPTLVKTAQRKYICPLFGTTVGNFPPGVKMPPPPPHYPAPLGNIQIARI